jgi:hypothetical protein
MVVSSNTTVKGTMKVMGLVQKMRLVHVKHEAMVVASMHVVIPMIWGGESTMAPLPVISKYEKWSYGSTMDFKSMLECNLSQVYSELSNAARLDLNAPKAILLANELRTKTLSFLTQLHSNLESTYLNFKAHGYPKDAAQKLAKTITQRILTSLADVHTGAHNPGVGNNTKLVASVLWSVLQCHVQMQALLGQGLQDHPIVTSKISHFMHHNLNLMTMNKLTTEVLKVSGDVAALKMKLVSAKKMVQEQDTSLSILKRKVK